MRTALLVGAAALALAVTAARAEPENPKVSLFAQDAAISNEYEMAESKIILEDSKNPTLRQFAMKMIEDHGKAQHELAMAGRMAGVATDFVLDKGHQADVNDLGLMDGNALDKMYVENQVAAHQSAAANLAGYAMNGTDPALRAYARKTLPVVLMHQRMLEQITGQPAGA